MPDCYWRTRSSWPSLSTKHEEQQQQWRTKLWSCPSPRTDRIQRNSNRLKAPDHNSRQANQQLSRFLILRRAGLLEISTKAQSELHDLQDRFIRFRGIRNMELVGFEDFRNISLEKQQPAFLRASPSPVAQRCAGLSIRRKWQEA